MSVRARLSVMMFLQYFVWGSWAVSAGGYLFKALHFSGPDVGLIYSTTAIGAIFAPLFVGYVADRFFATEKILAVLHGIGGVLLAVAANLEEVQPLFITMISYSLCYMPTLALTNSLSFQNITDPETEFPRIRVFGTVGWIAAGLIVGILLGGTANTFFYLAAGASIILGLYCLTLPHTPPRGSGEGDLLGLGALGLFKEPSFAIFAVCSFLICIPLNFYYTFANSFLVDIDAPAPTALQTLGQFSEVFFMAAMPFFIVRLGVKYMLLVGMLAWVARYLCFSSLNFSLVLIGLVLHGVCYDFFFVASQIYVDRKSPRHLRASAQSLIAFITLGLGMFIGANVNGWIVGRYPPITVTATGADGKTLEKAPLPTWADKNAGDSAWRYLDLTATVRRLIFGEQPAPERGPDFGAVNDIDGNGKLSLKEIPDTWVEQPDASNPEANVTYSGTALRAAFSTIDRDSAGSVSRAAWRRAQASDWRIIWLWPAAMSAVTCLLFWIGFRDRVSSGSKEQA